MRDVSVTGFPVVYLITFWGTSGSVDGTIRPYAGYVSGYSPTHEYCQQRTFEHTYQISGAYEKLVGDNLSYAGWQPPSASAPRLRPSVASEPLREFGWVRFRE